MRTHGIATGQPKSSMNRPQAWQVSMGTPAAEARMTRRGMSSPAPQTAHGRSHRTPRSRRFRRLWKLCMGRSNDSLVVPAQGHPVSIEGAAAARAGREWIAMIRFHNPHLPGGGIATEIAVRIGLDLRFQLAKAMGQCTHGSASRRFRRCARRMVPVKRIQLGGGEPRARNRRPPRQRFIAPDDEHPSSSPASLAARNFWWLFAFKDAAGDELAFTMTQRAFAGATEPFKMSDTRCDPHWWLFSAGAPPTHISTADPVHLHILDHVVVH